MVEILENRTTVIKDRSSKTRFNNEAIFYFLDTSKDNNKLQYALEMVTMSQSIVHRDIDPCMSERYH